MVLSQGAWIQWFMIERFNFNMDVIIYYKIYIITVKSQGALDASDGTSCVENLSEYDLNLKVKTIYK